MRDLNDLLFFAEVVDRGGFAAAGRALNLPRSRLSRRVAELEARLGVRLLHRTTRSLSLTPAGEIYFSHCVGVRGQAEAAEEALALIQSEPRGTVRVACPVTLAQTTIAPIIPRFLLAHPKVRIDMQVSNRVVNPVHEGIDVALRVRSSSEDSGTLVVKNLGPTRGVLIASPSLLERLGRPTGVSDLERLPTVAMSARNGRASWLLQGPRGERHRMEHSPVYTADDLVTLKHAVLQGIGAGVLPDYLCVDELRAGTMATALPGWGPPEGKVLAVFPSRRGMAPALRHFLEFIGEAVLGAGVLRPT